MARTKTFYLVVLVLADSSLWWISTLPLLLRSAWSELMYACFRSYSKGIQPLPLIRVLTYVDVWKPYVLCSVRMKKYVLVTGGVRCRWKEMGHLLTKLRSVWIKGVCYEHLIFVWMFQSHLNHTGKYLHIDWLESFIESKPFSLYLTDEWVLTLRRESLQYRRIVVSRAMSW